MKCVSINGTRKTRTMEELDQEYNIKVEALRLAAQLPRDRRDALNILRMVETLVNGYLSPQFVVGDNQR